MYHFKRLIYLSIIFGVSVIHAGAFDDFFQAVRTDNARGVTDLLARGFDPNTHETSGQSALTLAVREGSTQVIEALLKHPQIDLNAPNSVGETALMLAALKGNLGLVQRLTNRDT